jgi:hypothetical protein
MITAEQFHTMLADLGITQVGLAKLIGVSDGTSRRWSREGITDGPAAILLRLLHEKTIGIARIEAAHPERRAGPIRIEDAHELRYQLAMNARGLKPKPKTKRSKQ